MLSRADVRAHLVLVVIILHGCGMFLQIVVRVCCSYTGHGINDLFHTAPNVPHYAKNKAVGIMSAGQTFTIEPMINAGSGKVRWQHARVCDGTPLPLR
eukprot:COSAG01_NODE_16084_length_1272_cov_1.092072_2_plen_98_part_00